MLTSEQRDKWRRVARQAERRLAWVAEGLEQPGETPLPVDPALVLAVARELAETEGQGQEK